MRKSSITSPLVGAPMRDNPLLTRSQIEIYTPYEIEIQWPVNLATLLRILDFLRRFSHRDITLWITNSRKLRELSDTLASRAGDKLGSVTWRNLEVALVMATSVPRNWSSQQVSFKELFITQVFQLPPNVCIEKMEIPEQRTEK